jgi:hypothetical protein
MKKLYPYLLFISGIFASTCSQPHVKKRGTEQIAAFHKGEFGYDLTFLQKRDSGLVVLKDAESQVIVSPRYQSKVFTSTAQGEHGLSFGWINYNAFSDTVDSHMNAYGGENRLWLGPEGGKFSLFFPPGSEMVFKNWKTPAPIDTESWLLLKKDSNYVSMKKEMSLVNYQGYRLKLSVYRKVRILPKAEIMSLTNVKEKDSIYAVGYETTNVLQNEGEVEWTISTGMPCLWILDMFRPSQTTVIVVPFQPMAKDSFSKIVTTNYFGEIPADRIKHLENELIFKADGKSRGKLGIAANRAKNVAGSYDAGDKVLTIILFDLDAHARYLNQEWNLRKPPFQGDAVNAYNDGPLPDGSQMGPFYEIESVSPAAFLKPHESLTHRQSVFHFTGEEEHLNAIAFRMLGISLENLKSAL